MVLARRALVAAVATALLAAVPAPAATPSARAGAKRCVTKKAGVRKVRRCKAKAKPKAVTPKPAPVTAPLIKVAVELLEGSMATVEIPSLALPGGQLITGTGVTRDVPLTGGFNGGVDNRVRSGRDIPVHFDTGAIHPGAVDLLSDPACGGAAALRLNPFSSVGLDPANRTLALLHPESTVSTSAFVVMRLAFDMRVEPGCDKPLVSVGYADTPFAVKLYGKLGADGLLDFNVASQATPVTVSVCLTPGPADQPCGGWGPAAYPVKITVRLRIGVSLST